MVLNEVLVKYGSCKYCESSHCISCYTPRVYISLLALKTGLKRNCENCGAVLEIESVKAKVAEKN